MILVGNGASFVPVAFCERREEDCADGIGVTATDLVVRQTYKVPSAW